ncbi:phosphatase PAP2 family protein [Pigmentibacter ruber]
MTLDLPPQTIPQHYEEKLSNWSSFNPGEWKQDIFTIPLEIGLIAGINQYSSMRSTPLWPFNNEVADKDPKETTYPRSKLLPYALGTSAAIIGGLSLYSSDFPTYRHGIGWIHAHLLTEVATSTAKVTFQRKRPFYDKKVSQGNQPSIDDKYSFFSGHASHAFTFATYSSALLFKYSDSSLLNWTYASLIYTGASIIAASRVTDNAHNTSDVITGAIVGTIISAFVFFRVEEVNEKKQEKLIHNLNMSPIVYRDEVNKSWYGINVDFNI